MTVDDWAKVSGLLRSMHESGTLRVRGVQLLLSLVNQLVRVPFYQPASHRCNLLAARASVVRRLRGIAGESQNADQLRRAR